MSNIESNSSAIRPLRRLGAMERIFYSYGLGAQVLFAIVAEVAGTTDQAELASAFAALKERHPFLSVGVADDPEEGLVFVPSNEPLTFEFIEAEEGAPWTDAVSAALNRWEKLQDGGLFKATIVRHATRFVVILTFNHTIADGRGGVAILDDFIQLLGGRRLSRHEGLPLMDDIARRHPASGPLKLPDFLQPTTVKTSGDLPISACTLDLGRDLTGRLVERCRAEGVTVHGALCAAAAIATANNREGPLRLSSPVDLREVSGREPYSPGMFMALAAASLELQDGEGVWALARRSLASIAATKSADAISSLVATLEEIHPVHGDHKVAQAILAPLTLDLMISNLGRLPVKPIAGNLRVEAVWAPGLNTQIEANDVIGVTSFGGTIRMIHIHSRAQSSLLSDMRVAIENHLLAATY